MSPSVSPNNSAMVDSMSPTPGHLEQNVEGGAGCRGRTTLSVLVDEFDAGLGHEFGCLDGEAA